MAGTGLSNLELYLNGTKLRVKAGTLRINGALGVKRTQVADTDGNFLDYEMPSEARTLTGTLLLKGDGTEVTIEALRDMTHTTALWKRGEFKYMCEQASFAELGDLGAEDGATFTINLNGPITKL
jgi:hypothetical protein